MVDLDDTRRANYLDFEVKNQPVVSAKLGCCIFIGDVFDEGLV